MAIKHSKNLGPVRDARVVEISSRRTPFIALSTYKFQLVASSERLTLKNLEKKAKSLKL